MLPQKSAPPPQQCAGGAGGRCWLCWWWSSKIGHVHTTLSGKLVTSGAIPHWFPGTKEKCLLWIFSFLCMLVAQPNLPSRREVNGPVCAAAGFVHSIPPLFGQVQNPVCSLGRNHLRSGFDRDAAAKNNQLDGFCGGFQSKRLIAFSCSWMSKAIDNGASSTLIIPAFPASFVPIVWFPLDFGSNSLTLNFELRSIDLFHCKEILKQAVPFCPISCNCSCDATL